MNSLDKLQQIAIYIFFFSINFEMWDPIGTGGIFSVAKLTAIMYLMTVMPDIPQFIRADSLKSVLLPIWIFLGFLTIMSIININEISSEFFYMPMFLNMIIFWFLINHERKSYLIIEKGMLWFALGAIVIVFLFFAGIGVEYGMGGRLSMFGDNQNVLGIRVTVASIVLILTVIQNRLNLGGYRYLFLLAIPFMLIFIRETGSRVSIIAYVLAFLTGTLLYKTNTKLAKIGILIGSAIIIVLIGITLIQSERLVERFQSTSDTGDLGERDNIWKAIVPIIKDNPIVGIGKTGYDFETTLIWGRSNSPHNVILEILCYTGIIGLLIYLTFLFRVLKIGYQTYSKNGWLLPVLLIIPIAGLLLSGQILDNKIGWIIFAYIISSSAISIKFMKNKTKEILVNENSLRN